MVEDLTTVIRRSRNDVLSSAKKAMRNSGWNISGEPICNGIDFREEFIRIFENEIAGRMVWNESYDKVLEWMRNPQGYGLVMYGQNGLGKSVIGNSIIPEYIRRLNCVDIRMEIDKPRAYKTNLICECVSAIDMGDSMDELRRCSYLSIDDIGTEGEHVVYGSRSIPFAELVDNAEKNDNMLFVSTNLTLKQIRDKYGYRTYDRLNAMTRQILFLGESKRI